MQEAGFGGGHPLGEAWVVGGAAAQDAAPAGRNEPSTPRPCGACHKCGAQVKDASRVLVCDGCGCRYHTFDCGSRIYCAGVTVGTETACPRCAGLCACAGGKVLCHTAAQRQKRKEAGAASLRRKRVVGKASPRGPAGKGSGSGGAGPTPSASASEDTSVIASMHARRSVKAEHGAQGTAALAGLAGLAALAGAVTDPQLAPRVAAAAQAAAPPAAPAAQHAFSMQIASFYALQTELLLFKTRAAQLEVENAALRRLLQNGAGAQQQAAAHAAPAAAAHDGPQPAALQLVAPPPSPSGAAAAWMAQAAQQTPHNAAASNIASVIGAALAAQGGGFNPGAPGASDMASIAQNLPLLIALAQQQQQQQQQQRSAAAPAS